MNELVLPQDKHDLERAQVLLACSESELEPYLPELLEWLGDLNWPVAQIVFEVLHKISPDKLWPFFQAILTQTEDGVWKYNCLTYIETAFSGADLRMLQEDLEAIQANLTERDKLEEVDLMLTDLLGKIRG